MSLEFHRVSFLMYLLVLASLSYFDGCQGCSKEEIIAIKDIIRSIDGPNATTNWIGEDCCELEEIGCDNVTSRVTYIDLGYGRDSRLGKWYPDVSLFSRLKDLRGLNLKQTNIAGWINPQAFCELKHLVRLDLSQNSINGSIHPCLCNMHSLRDLDLSANLFQGEIPLCFSDMQSLQYLDLSYNRLQGTIPSIFSNFTGLEDIDMSNNQFEGVVSLSIFANLSKLKDLDLSNNNKLEVETEFPNWFPSFQLEKLYLANCNLNKRIGSRIPSFLSSYYSLKYLDLSYNSLVGSIPFSVFNNTLEVLHLESNKLSGPFPQAKINMISKLDGLDISNNQIYGSLPTNIGVLFPNLNIFNISVNALQGSIPSSFGQLTQLIILDLSDNRFTGEIPNTLTSSETYLQYLSLSNNMLDGEILPVTFNMSSLECLQLANNRFVGNIPSSLSNSFNLKILDVRKNNLSGTIPTWLPYSNLKALLLGGNHFDGHIPRQLCQMQKLQFLDLSMNFLSGSIPSCFNNITFWWNKTQGPFGSTMFLTVYWETYYFFIRGNQILDDDLQRVTAVDFTTKGRGYSFKGDPLYLMVGLDVSSNQLTGNIPSELGDLKLIRSVNLSNNALTGTFPLSFQHLKNLESLDLSHNKLSGIIPHEIDQLDSLSTFSVAYNNFSGKIPSERKFSTFSANSFVGNQHLCGQPLEINCSAIVSAENPNNEGEEESGIFDRPVFFYLYIAMSYALGLWCVIAPLLFIKTWRQKYYRTMDEYTDFCYVKFFKVKLYLKKKCGCNP